jgi:hypothetical protein
MVPLIHARDVLQQILSEHKTLKAQSYDSVYSHYIEDRQNGEYLIIHTGYDEQEGHRVYGMVFHVWFRDDKIWVERDSVFPSITGEMVERGVPTNLFTHAPYRLPMPEPA